MPPTPVDERFMLRAVLLESYGRTDGDPVKALKALDGVADEHGNLSTSTPWQGGPCSLQGRTPRHIAVLIRNTT